MASMIGKSIHANPKDLFAFPRRRYFSLPYNLINCLTDACDSPIVFSKLQSSCKYFFSKKRIIICDATVSFSTNLLYYSLKNDDSVEKIFELNDSCKFWLTGTLLIKKQRVSPYIHYCNLNILGIFDENLTFKEISFLLNSGKIKELFLQDVNIRCEDGTPVTLDIVLGQCPKVQNLLYSNMCETFSTNTFEKLNRLKVASKFGDFDITIYHIVDAINPNILCEYLKKKIFGYTLIRIIFKCEYSLTELQNFESTIRVSLENILRDSRKLCVQRE